MYHSTHSVYRMDLRLSCILHTVVRHKTYCMWPTDGCFPSWSRQFRWTSCNLMITSSILKPSYNVATTNPLPLLLLQCTGQRLQGRISYRIVQLTSVWSCRLFDMHTSFHSRESHMSCILKSRVSSDWM